MAMSSELNDLLKQMRDGLEHTAAEPSDPPPVDQNKKNDPMSLGQQMMAKIENFLQSATNAGAAAPPEAAGAEDPNAQAAGASTVTLQVPANAVVKIAEEITTKDGAISFLTSCGLLEEGK